MKLFILLPLFLCGVTASYSQEVTVTATTDKNQIEAILKKGHEDARANRAFFAEYDSCRGLLKTREWARAESTCRNAILLVEKLPKEHVLERSGVRTSVAIALLWQRKTEEAVRLLNTSLELRKTVAGDSDADTGDLYFLLGQAHSLLPDVDAARSYYDTAERSYRLAIIEIGDDDFRVDYTRRLRAAVEAHYNLVKSAGLPSVAAALESRLAQLDKEFAKYLVN